MNAVMSVANYLIKIVNTCAAAKRVKQVYDKKDRTTADTVDAVVHSAFAVLQLGDIAFSVRASPLSEVPLPGVQASAAKVASVANSEFNRWRTGVRIGTNTVAIACAITEPLAQKGGLDANDWLSVVTASAFRSADGLQQFYETYPEALKWDPQTVKTAADVLETSAKVINHREEIKKIANEVIKIKVIEIGANIRQRILAMRNGAQPPANILPNPVQDPQPVPNIDEAVAAASALVANNQIQMLIQGINNDFIHLNEIPEILHSHPSLRQNRCCISQTPIRYILVPRLTDEELQHNPQLLNIKYERAAIETWGQNHPNENPPDWPANLPFSQDNLKTSPRLQHVIMQNLNNAAKELRNYEPQ